MRAARWMILSIAPLALVAPVAANAATAATAAVITVTDVGWWSRRPGATAQPAAYFEVANGLQGEESVAALRVPLAGAVLSATIELTESGGVAQQAAVLKLCTTSTPWTPANPGAFADAPKPDCTVSVEPKREASGKWSADVTGLLAAAGAAGAANVMVLPVPAPVGGLVDPGFNIQFSPAVIRADYAPASTAPANNSGSLSGSIRSSGSASYPATAVGAAPRAPLGTVPATSAPAASTPAAPTGVGLPGQIAAPLDISVRRAGSGRPKPWGRLIWLVPLSAAGGIGAALARRRLARSGTHAQAANAL